MFFGYFLPAAVMAAEEDGPAVPELARRMTLTSCHLDPARALAPVLTAMPQAGIPLGDIIDDSGYAHRAAAAWAIPLRHAGAQLVQDLHPHERRGQDPPETRLPVSPVAAVLPAAHQRRTGQRHHQGHRQQQQRTRLVPTHRPDPAHTMARPPARHPQPAHPHRPPSPPHRQRPPRRRRPAAPHPQTAPHQPRPARRRAITPQRRHATQHPQQARPHGPRAHTC